MVKADKILDALKNKMDIFGARKLYYLRERRTWTCLAATPNNLYGTVSSTIEFRDELRDRYGFGILSAPSYCDGCNLKFSITHALGCKKDGLIHLGTTKVVIRSAVQHAPDSNPPMFVTNLK